MTSCSHRKKWFSMAQDIKKLHEDIAKLSSLELLGIMAYFLNEKQTDENRKKFLLVRRYYEVQLYKEGWIKFTSEGL